MKTWYERLRDRRQELGLSQADIMRAVGVSNATASDWESGKTSPRGENLIKLCKHLRISTEWLVYGKGSLEDGQGPHPQPIAPGPTGAPAEPTLQTLLDALAARLAQADPSIRQEIAQLVMRYMENPQAGARIAAAVELLLEKHAPDDSAL